MAESVLSEVKGSADEVVDSVLPQAESPVFEVFQLYRSTDWSRVVVLSRKGLESSMSPLTATPSPGDEKSKNKFWRQIQMQKKKQKIKIMYLI